MEVVVIIHNIRSAHNVGAILRTCDGFGASRVYFTGYSPYPTQINDSRLPHIRNKLTGQIHKTALGAEINVPNEHVTDVIGLLNQLKTKGFQVVALEQSPKSVNLTTFKPRQRLALLLGEEVKGITKGLLDICDAAIEIPMVGKKESFNVSVATGIALYQLCLRR